MRLAFQTLLLLLATTGAQAATPAPSPASAGAKLHALFESEWERQLRENPVQATYLGDHRFDDRWPEASRAAIEKSHAGDVAVLDALKTVPTARLTGEDPLNKELFRRMYQDSVDAYGWGLQFLPMNQRDGVQTAADLAELIQF